MKSLILAVVSLVLAPAAQAAHCACGGDAFPGAAISADTVGFGSVSLSWGAGYTWYESINREDFENRARRPGGIGRMEGPDSLAAGSVSIAWGLTPRWQVGLSQSWQRMENYREGIVDAAGAYEHREHGSLAGLKDLGLSVKNKVAEGAWGKFALQGDLSLPTGSQVQSPLSGPDPGNTLNSRARRLPTWVQPGRGSLDGAISAAYSWANEAWFSDISYGYSIPSTTAGYRSGARGTLAGAFGIFFNGHDSLSADLLYVQAESDVDQGQRVWSTGGAFVGVGPRGSVSLNDRTQLTAQLMWPVLFGTAGEEGTRATVQTAARLSTAF